MPREPWLPWPCSTNIVRGDDTDWIYFGLPMGSLARALPVGAFPIEDGSDLSWRVGLDAWLRTLAEHLFVSVLFRLALVGWTDGPDESAASLEQSGVPAARWVGYLVPSGERSRGTPRTGGRR